jgi:hypothetical protein
MDEAACSVPCREHGLYPSELAGWKQDAIAGLARMLVKGDEGPTGIKLRLGHLALHP